MAEKNNYQDEWPHQIDLEAIKTPAFVIDEQAIVENVKTFERIQNETGCKFILALKTFASPHFFPLISEKFYGVAAGSPWEARLGSEKFGKEIHAFSPAYRDENEVGEYTKVCSHMSFNSFSQWNRFKKKLLTKNDTVKFGIRVNPEISEIQWALYDPSAPKSRFGVRSCDFENQDLDGISGLHFHNLCELNADSLERTLAEFEKKFGKYLSHMSWVNFGGGHYINSDNYNVDLLIKILKDFKQKYPHLEVYLEPGTSVLMDTGVLVSSVLDVIKNEVDIATLDASAAAHMPEVIELDDYTPYVLGSGEPGKLGVECRLVGSTCMTGDIFGDYSFPEKLKVGDKLIFLDMAQYTIVRMNTFCGVQLPSIYARTADGKIKLIRKFDYGDFESRLAK